MMDIDELRRQKGNFSKEEIIEICLKELKEHGYIFLKEHFPKTSEDALDTAVPELVNSGEYIPDPTPFQKKWVIRKNPNFKIKTQRDIETDELNFRKLNADVINSERVYKTYSTTRGITWVTFIIMLILAALKIAESLRIWPYHK